MASLATCRAMLPLIVARPAWMRSSLRSCRRTSRPASAQTWAIPLPIWPAPITPTVLISVAIAGPPSPGFRPRLAELAVELWQDGEQVADEPVIRDLKDRGLLVLVDR